MFNWLPVENGSVFFSYPAMRPRGTYSEDQAPGDTNYRAAVAFCHEQNQRLLNGPTFATLRKFPDPLSASHDNSEMAIYHSAVVTASLMFARAALGTKFSVAVDYSRPNSVFRTLELHELLSNPTLQEVQRIIVTGDQCAETPAYKIVLMDKETWFFEQSKQWFDASLAVSADEIVNEIQRLDCVFQNDRTFQIGNGIQQQRRLETYNRLCTWMLETRMDAICDHGAAEQAMGNLLDRLRYTEKTLRADLDIASAL